MKGARDGPIKQTCGVLVLLCFAGNVRTHSKKRPHASATLFKAVYVSNDTRPNDHARGRA